MDILDGNPNLNWTQITKFHNCCTLLKPGNSQCLGTLNMEKMWTQSQKIMKNVDSQKCGLILTVSQKRELKKSMFVFHQKQCFWHKNQIFLSFSTVFAENSSWQPQPQAVAIANCFCALFCAVCASSGANVCERRGLRRQPPSYTNN